MAEKMSIERAAEVVRQYPVSHGGKFTSPAIYRAADVLLERVEELEARKASG